MRNIRHGRRLVLVVLRRSSSPPVPLTTSRRTSRSKMISVPKQSVMWVLALFIAPNFATTLAWGLPHFSKKQNPENVLPARKLTASQSQLIDKSIARVKEVRNTVKERAPLVETYLQNMRPDDTLGQVPESDQ